MKKLTYLFLALIIVACSSDDSSDGSSDGGDNGGDGQSSCIYLDTNGVTIKACDDANVGDTGVIDGVTYTVVDEDMLRDMVDNEEDVTKVVTTKVTNMNDMFSNDVTFNQDIHSWDVSNVSEMGGMFYSSPFNQDISSWDVTNVNNMQKMFGNTPFNQDIRSWDVSNVTKMGIMFYGSPFNQSIGNWDVSSVTEMNDMFAVSNFNQDISSWDVSNVTDMYNMFREASNFNQDISSWSVDNVIYCDYFSDNAPLTEANTPNFTNCTP